MWVESVIGRLFCMTQTSPPKLYADVEAELGEPLAQFVARHRASGVSWRRIANAIIDRTGIDITGETLRVWSQGRAPVAAVPPGTPRPSTPPTTPKPPSGPGRVP